ncbi:LysE family transporter [Vibrio sonorensis]|uniref:LysE family transporter n=1 Tax=Vibrio sonorensis TaxID=1004316 RepID=UPI003CCBBCBB
MTTSSSSSSTADNSSLLLSSRKQAFAKGFATNLLNPKALVFFVSLMSTLVPASMSFTGKGAALAILFSLSLFWFSFLAWVLSAPKLQNKLQSMAHYIDGLCGAVFSLLGGTILFQSLSQLITQL